MSGATRVINITHLPPDRKLSAWKWLEGLGWEWEVMAGLNLANTMFNGHGIELEIGNDRNQKAPAPSNIA